MSDQYEIDALRFLMSNVAHINNKFIDNNNKEYLNAKLETTKHRIQKDIYDDMQNYKQQHSGSVNISPSNVPAQYKPVDQNELERELADLMKDVPQDVLHENQPLDHPTPDRTNIQPSQQQNTNKDDRQLELELFKQKTIDDIFDNLERLFQKVDRIEKKIDKVIKNNE